MKLLKNFFFPLIIVRSDTSPFVLWVAFSLIGGLIGILVSILKHWLFTAGMDFTDAIIRECRNGSFYTYSIALFASSLSSIFLSMLGDSTVSFRKRKIYVLSLLIYSLIFSGVLYALSVDFDNSLNSNGLSQKDWIQLGTTFLAILVAVYSFCISRLELLWKDEKALNGEEMVENASSETNRYETDSKNLMIE